MNPFIGVYHLLQKAFSAIFGSDAAKHLLSATEEILKTALGKFALQVVQDLAGMDITSAQKWELAGAKIASQAVVLGVAIGKSEINLLVELVYSLVAAAPLNATER